MAPSDLTLNLTSADETAAVARRLSGLLSPGDCVLLQGPIGAGKTHFARHLIQSVQIIPEDVPSPTFTLIQTYDTRIGEIWHADLYRISSLDEIGELGLLDAFETGICLVEWPERMGELAPRSALCLEFSTPRDDFDSRRLDLRWRDSRWDAVAREIADG